MCGITGSYDLRGRRGTDPEVLAAMSKAIVHRGPDSAGVFRDDGVGLAMQRLSIIDLETGDQPLFNESKSLALVCNGEIFNFKSLRQQLEAKGHTFASRSDVEVLLHLYENHGDALLERLNGQFAFALYDRPKHRLFLARDHLGIAPLYYTVADGWLIFGSEIKAILEHPAVERRVDLTGLDQVFTLPGLVGQRTLFEGIHRLPNGHCLVAEDGEVTVREYWDLVYPRDDEMPEGSNDEEARVAELRERLFQSVEYRLQADVPVGFYLSGGLDSSLVAGIIHELVPDVQRHAFSITFDERRADESKYQRMVAEQVDCHLHSIPFDGSRIADGLSTMIHHCECPVKEAYNTCSLALSEAARAEGIKVILAGEGSDELFAGYVGYRFDQSAMRQEASWDADAAFEDDLRQRLWGDRDLFYEYDYFALGEIRQALYAPELRPDFHDFDCLREPLVRHDRLAGRHRLHQRSYLDYKLRMADHLLMDHGDQMALGNSVEARYPFLDLGVVELATRIAPELKLKGFQEKYVVRRAAEGLVPSAILEREKFGWFAPGSPQLLQQNVEWIEDVLSQDRIRRQGYFDPATIERLKTRYRRPGFQLNHPFEQDLLMIVATFGVFLDVFDMPDRS